MPEGPEHNQADLPAYPEFRRRLIADCLRLHAPVPDDRVIAAEFEQRAVILARARAIDQVMAFNTRLRLTEGGEPAMSVTEQLEFFNPYKQFTGCWLPNWLLERDELDLGLKVTYARLAQFAGRNGVAVVKQDVLARKLGVDERSVSRWLTKLRQAGLVHITRRGPYKPAEYRFLHHRWMLGAVALPDTPDWRIKTRQIGGDDTTDSTDHSSNREKRPKRGEAASPPRPEVDELCQLLADRIIANDGSPAVYRPRVATAAWRDPMRLLLDKDLAVDKDGTTVPLPERIAKVRKAINWCQDDEFWRGNILSPGALRKKYDNLRLAWTRANGNGHGVRNGHPDGDRDRELAATRAWLDREQQTNPRVQHLARLSEEHARRESP